MRFQAVPSYEPAQGKRDVAGCGGGAMDATQRLQGGFRSPAPQIVDISLSNMVMSCVVGPPG